MTCPVCRPSGLNWCRGPSTSFASVSTTTPGLSSLAPTAAGRIKPAYLIAGKGVNLLSQQLARVAQPMNMAGRSTWRASGLTPSQMRSFRGSVPGGLAGAGSMVGAVIPSTSVYRPPLRFFR